MDIWATNDGFAVGMMRFGEWEPKWNKKDKSLSITGKREHHISVETGRGIFIECLDDGGKLLMDGGDGHWFYVPPGEATVTLRHKKLPEPELTAAAINKARKSTTVYVAHQQQYDGGPFTFGASYTDGSLDEVLASLQKIRDSIPKQYRAKARCAIDSKGGYEGSHYASIEVSYERPETDEEVIERVKIDTERQRLKSNEELSQFKKLRAKFCAG